MISKTNDTQIKLLFDIILQESRTHRELLKHVGEFLGQGSNPSFDECSEQMGQLFVQALAFIRSAKEGVSRGKTVSEVVGGLIDFEQSASEEYLTEMHLGIRAGIEGNNVVKRILEGIAADERNHVEILHLVDEAAAKA